MGKMADLAYDPAKEENAAEEAPVAASKYRSSANLHADDMKTMGLAAMAPGDHAEGMIHGVVSHAHEGGMMLHITHGAMKKAGGKSQADKMYAEEKSEGE